MSLFVGSLSREAKYFAYPTLHELLTFHLTDCADRLRRSSQEAPKFLYCYAARISTLSYSLPFVISIHLGIILESFGDILEFLDLASLEVSCVVFFLHLVCTFV